LHFVQVLLRVFCSLSSADRAVDVIRTNSRIGSWMRVRTTWHLYDQLHLFFYETVIDITLCVFAVLALGYLA
jgi:hypothetical protein